MELRSGTMRRQSDARLVNHRAQCGAVILMPEWSEYLDRSRVRHLWACEGCDYKFETTVQFAEA
jgi:hypothetical protein